MNLRAMARRALGVASLRGIRGATSVPSDDPLEIAEAVGELIDALQTENRLLIGEVVSAIFTVTPDLVSSFPAGAARAVGWHDVPLLCTTEIPVQGALPRCIRVLLHVERVWSVGLPRHVYLREAGALRPDLTSGRRSREVRLPAGRN